MSIIELEPKHVWKQFDGIRKVPRPSKHEEKIREHLLALAKERNLETKVDATGNVVIQVPATPGHETAPVVVLQSHMDMVCEKNADVGDAVPSRVVDTGRSVSLGSRVRPRPRYRADVHADRSGHQAAAVYTPRELHEADRGNRSHRDELHRAVFPEAGGSLNLPMAGASGR